MAELQIHLTPHFDSSGHVTGLLVSQTFIKPEIKANNVICISYEESLWRGVELVAQDDLGAVSIALVDTHRDKHSQISWEADRDTDGDIVVQYRIKVRAISEHGSETDERGLHTEEGGIICLGEALLLFPPGSTERYRTTTEWDLSESPPRTRAIWTWGEGPKAVSKDVTIPELRQSVFMVGPVQSYPTGDDLPNPTERTGSCDIYWLGELPSDLTAMKDFTAGMFKKQAIHFKDIISDYRVFLRRNERGLRIMSLSGCLLLDFDIPHRKDTTDADLVRMINQAMVKNWVGLDAEDDGNTHTWYAEGIAQLYTVFFPFRFGFRTPEYFRSTLNSFLTEYFTNPLLNVPMPVIARDESVGWFRDNLSVSRGFLYFLKLDGALRRAARAKQLEVLRPMDEIIVALAERRRKGDKIQVQDWLESLYPLLGQEEAQRLLNNMLTGNRLDLDDMPNSFGASHAPVEVQQPVLSFGFDPTSFDDGVLSGLVNGSPAESSGLKNGDKILWHTPIWSCSRDMNEKMTLIVERDGRRTEASFWPRSSETVTSWQVLKITE